MNKFVKITVAFFLVALICYIPFYIVVFKILPERDPDNLFNRSTILQVLSGETRVFYEDGENLLGAFFDANHRVYVPYGDIPVNLINALIAAEDSRYWSHNGYDLKGFMRAMVNNIKARRFVQGGSSLTQQAVKNIFGREERSIKEKLKEFLNALRMEKHFSKEDILEFYLNQFHVSGTGKGVAIAAQYFFNKELKDLTLAECAFIAGSVKGPFNYDPFIQRTEERKQKAIERGETRLKYVLGRMVEEGYIEQAEMDSALTKPLEFNHGNFRFTMSTTLERLEERLDSDFFHDLFKEEGIEDWRKAQLEITTTLNAKSQDAAKRALQTNISNLQLQLGGFVLPKAQFANRARNARKGDYLYGAVDSVFYDSTGRLQSLKLNFGQLKGIVTEQAVNDFAKLAGGDVNKILATQLKPGAILLVSIIDETPIDGYAPCKIETEPVLQGALVAIQNGKVLASQGGFHNTGFDRSFKALRQLGSSWKPILYALALKYHWNYLDNLENEFNVFQYGNQFYFPRPDHKNKGDVVSIAWAATRSENIASIWLLEHLLDKLSDKEFEDVARQNGFAREPGEERIRFVERLRDKSGLMMKEEVKREIEFTKARDALVERYMNDGKILQARAVQNLRYGMFNDIGLKQAKRDPKVTKYVNHNFKRYSEIWRAREIQELDPDESANLQPLDSVQLIDNFTLADFKRLNAMIEPVDSDADYYDMAHLRYWPDYRRALSMADYARFANEIGIRQKLQKVFSMPLGVNDITLAEISTAYQTILTGKIFKCKDADWTEPCFIKEIRNRDGRVIFRNKMESRKVLDDTVTTQVGVMLRSVFTNGTAHSQLKALSIKNPEGAAKLRFPVMGKTGTTNDYRNVAFLGALPTYVKEKNGIALDSVIAIGSYVGFDDNKPLKSGRTRIAGASGGLPQWATFAKEEMDIIGLPKKIDFLDISMLATGEVPLMLTNERGELTVDPMTGEALVNGEKGRPLPWIDVPGFTPPQVQKIAAETIAKSGIVVSLPMPQTETVPAENAPHGTTPDSAAVSAQGTTTSQQAIPADARPVSEVMKADSLKKAAEAAKNVPAETQTPQPKPAATQAPQTATPAVKEIQPPKPQAAMPKDDDWDLPENFNSKNAFVPIEVDTE
ncbi:transglycosylase domain-containing protein [Fibrobacter succinogenes]|uniref:transglycosylase domain-containing protein n=1 Tax=Fibrobacter succinogenes TaxID=833 RepID=UPI00156A3D12|nr:transglycosylase domain-containing protein [Fibrobacter succinogenes]